MRFCVTTVATDTIDDNKMNVNMKKKKKKKKK